MKKKGSAALLAAALCLGLLAGCGGTPTGNGGDVTPTPGGASAQPTTPSPEATPSTQLDKPPQPEQILSDVNGYRYTVLPGGTTVTGCEVIKRQSNPEKKEDIVYCRLTGPEDGYKYAQYFVRLLYNFYDEGGWILDEMTEDQMDRWGTIGYLDSEGRPIEDGLVLIGPAGSYGGPSPAGPMPDGGDVDVPYDPDATPPPAGVARPSAHSYPTTINNEGMWDLNGKVYSFSGNEVSGLIQNTMANRAITWENRQLYLCDLDGKRLSAGYDSINYGGRVLDENGTTVDHRWQVRRDGKLGFLNDAGEEVIPLIYNAEENWGDFGSPYGVGDQKVCLLYDGGVSVVVDVNGRELLRTTESVTVRGAGFYTSRSVNDGSGAYYYRGYDGNGTQIFSGAYYQVDVTGSGFCGWLGWDKTFAWEIYSWDGKISHQVMDKEEALSSLYLLPDGYILGDYNRSTCIMRCTGYSINPNQITAYLDRYSYPGNSAYGNFTFYNHVLDPQGCWVLPPADREEQVEYYPIEGGLYLATESYSGKAALFDWKGNQRTDYFDRIVTYSENGRYLIVVKDGQYYAMKSPIGDAELQTAPARNYAW